MTQLTVRQAAERVGVSRQTMFRYIQQGRVSSTLRRDGEKQIQVAELLRVFGELQPETVSPTTTGNRLRQSLHDRETTPSVAYQIELERLKAQLELKAAELDMARERISELKTREHDFGIEKNRLLTLIEQQSRLLAPPAKAAAKRPSATKEKVKTAAAPALPQKVPAKTESKKNVKKATRK